MGNDLFEKAPIPKAYFSFALPVVFSMVISLVYNMADTYFIAATGNTNLVAGVSLGAPIFTLMIALGDIFGLGGSSVISRLFGKKMDEDGKRLSVFCFYGAIVCGIVVAVLMMLFRAPILTLLGAKADTVQYASDYYTWLVIGAPFIILSFTPSNLLRTEGFSVASMTGTVLGSVINIILDPILIFGLFGMPRLGVSGAAIATVCGQICGALLAFAFNIKVNTDINLNIKGFRPNKKIIGTIYSVGVPSIVMQAIGSVMTFGMNKILIQFTSTATAVFGVYFKLNSFIFMPIFGLNNGMVPIVAYNYGAKNKKRITHTIRLSIVSAICIMLLGLALFMIFPAQLLGLFNASGSMLQIGVPALRIICLSFTFAGFCIVVGSVFQALGNGIYSLIISATRQLLIILPVAALLAKLGGLSAVWWAIPIAEIASVLLSTFFFRKIYKEKIAPLGKA